YSHEKLVIISIASLLCANYGAVFIPLLVAVRVVSMFPRTSVLSTTRALIILPSRRFFTMYPLYRTFTIAALLSFAGNAQTLSLFILNDIVFYRSTSPLQVVCRG